MKQLFAFAAIALAGSLLAAAPEGKGQAPGRGVGPMGMEGANDPIVRIVTNPRIAEKIGLSEDQRKQIKEIEKNNRASNAELRKKLHEAAEKQAELLKEEKIDEAAVMAEIDKAYDARREMAKNQTRRVIAIKSILTPEQVEKALEAFKEMPRRGRGENARKGKGPNGPNCPNGPRGPKGPHGAGPDEDAPEGPAPEAEQPDCPPPPPAEEPVE